MAKPSLEDLFQYLRPETLAQCQRDLARFARRDKDAQKLCDAIASHVGGPFVTRTERERFLRCLGYGVD